MEERTREDLEAQLAQERRERARAQAEAEELRAELARLESGQRSLVQQQRLATLGSIVAGISHELNNPLTVIFGLGSMLATALEDEQLRRDMDHILRAANRTRTIIQELLQFCHQQEPQRAPTDLNLLVREILEEQEIVLASHHVELRVDLEPGLPENAVDPFRIQQVLVNLIKNAADALQVCERRVIELRTRLDPLDETRMRIEVHDTGPGIPGDVMQRLFEPFFTTKAPGKGTGLGLSICRQIAEGHGGRLWAENSAAGGALFVLELPLQEVAEDPARPLDLSDLQEVRVLVVDDQPEVRSVFVKQLEFWGCRVSAAGDAAQALAVLAQDPYDAIILDVVLGADSGEGLYQVLTREYPRAAERVLFCSARVGDEALARRLAATGRPLLPKPFTEEQLRAAVAALVRPGGGRYAILVVDDDHEVRELLVRVLSLIGSGEHHIQAAASGHEALGLLAQRPFDALLTDAQMPGVDGLELLRRCKLEHPATRVVVMTAYGGHALAEEIRRLGGDGYVEKPVVAEQLFQVMERVLRGPAGMA